MVQLTNKNKKDDILKNKFPSKSIVERETIPLIHSTQREKARIAAYIREKNVLLTY